MAKFYPSISTIEKFTKTPPTEGEWALLRFLEKHLEGKDQFEVYFNPYLNGDRPDIIIMVKNQGVLIIEVKDWHLEAYEINEKKQWVSKKNNAIIKSPIEQVLKYKRNLYDLHVNHLLAQKISDFKLFNVVSCAVYFHCADYEDIKIKLIDNFASDHKYQHFLRYNINFIGRDSLNTEAFNNLLENAYLISPRPSFLFSDEIYANFKRLLSPANHLVSQGKSINYSKQQTKIIYSKTLEQRVKGVFGSGKTTILAARAIQAYKRALTRHNNPKILILTYNITLVNFIRDRLSDVREDFPWEAFVIINYHQFIKAELNNLGVVVEAPKIPIELEQPVRTQELQEFKNNYFEQEYFGNRTLFEKHKNEIVKYDAVLIDEIQDYKRSWMDIIKNYFRSPEGDYVLFGDVKQNIYGNTIEAKDVVTNVNGFNLLKHCYRSNSKIKDLAIEFQRNVFIDKYDIDNLEENEEDKDQTLGFEEQKFGYVNYIYLQSPDPIDALYTIIHENIQNRGQNVSPNDITILAYETSLLRKFDAYYRYSCREKTESMVESLELMYLNQINYIKRTDTDNCWFTELFNQIASKKYPNRGITNYIEREIRKDIARIFSMYDLYKEYPTKVKTLIEVKCEECGMTFVSFLDYQSRYKEVLSKMSEIVYDSDYSFIQKNKKLHFYMNSGTIKLSTIHSFKGWESEFIFLIINSSFNKDEQSNLIQLDELLYTGFTRAKSKLVIINFGQKEYHKLLPSLIQGVKS